MTSTTSWTVGNAKTIFAKLTKIANEQLDVAGAPAEDAGSAGPQEVVDALEVIVQQLESRRRNSSTSRRTCGST